MTLPRPLARAVKRRRLSAFVDVDRLDLEFVDVGAIVVLGVGYRRLEHPLDDARTLLRD